MQENKNTKIFSIKTFLKRRNILIFVVFITIVILFLILFFEMRTISVLFRKYNNNVSELAGEVSVLGKGFDERMSKFNGSELLLSNMNKIISTIYFGTADSDVRKEAKDFTGFAMMYKEKYYIITAGHCVEFEGKKYKNFKFRANKTVDWIKPVLLDFKNDYEKNIDYAIFYLPNKVELGLIPAADGEEITPQYVLGNLERGLNLVKRYKDAIEGESGSPVLNSKCHVIGIIIKKDAAYTPIKVVLEALDLIKTE
jgi:hypothetical protein